MHCRISCNLHEINYISLLSASTFIFRWKIFTLFIISLDISCCLRTWRLEAVAEKQKRTVHVSRIVCWRGWIKITSVTRSKEILQPKSTQNFIYLKNHFQFLLRVPAKLSLSHIRFYSFLRAFHSILIYQIRYTFYCLFVCLSKMK